MKNQSRGNRRRQSMNEMMYHIARGETILERWYTDAYYQKSLSDEGWTEEKIRQEDKLALEDHSHEATLGERRRWENNWQRCLKERNLNKVR